MQRFKITTASLPLSASNCGFISSLLSGCNDLSASRVGSKDSQGSTGAQGLQGIQGYTGAQGDIGPQGNQGNTGAQGNIGPQGNQGYTGAQGDIGPQGIQGYTGAQGDIGPQGIQGYTGAQGVKGNEGATGAKGFTGAQGVKGNEGATGAQGQQGFLNLTGTTFGQNIYWNNSSWVLNGVGGNVIIGDYAGHVNQGNSAIAIGNKAGQTNQGIGAIAIGNTAGNTDQGANSICIGNNAGTTSMPSNCILFKASGNIVNPPLVSGATFVDTIRTSQPICSQTLQYNPETFEVSSYSYAQKDFVYCTLPPNTTGSVLTGKDIPFTNIKVNTLSSFVNTRWTPHIIGALYQMSFQFVCTTSCTVRFNFNGECSASLCTFYSRPYSTYFIVHGMFTFLPEALGSSYHLVSSSPFSINYTADSNWFIINQL